MSALVQLDHDRDRARRREVLRETLNALAARRAHYHQLASQNLECWRAPRTPQSEEPLVLVLAADWGEAAAALTRTYGECFAVLNPADAHHPGGGWLQGNPEWEENMWRRTDCSRSAGPSHGGRYTDGMTRLISGEDGIVYFDTLPRVCIRGPEDPTRDDLGYRWLRDDEVFPFFELRAAVPDLNRGVAFDEDYVRRRIAAQLDTLITYDVRHAVLGAYGSGDHGSPTERLAALYRQELSRRASAFDVVALLIADAGFGSDRYAAFADAFREPI